jgi:uncharacterized membrane protein
METVSKHTSDLIKEQKVGESLMEVNILVNIVESNYGEYTFYQYNIRRQKGCIIALPFFTYDKKHKQKLEGYLIYHNKESYGFSEKELFQFGVEAIVGASLSGMAGKLSPLPYKPIDEDEIEDVLDSLIEKNTKVNLNDALYI